MRFDNGADKLIMASANTSHFEIRLEIWKFLMMFAGLRHIDMLELGHSSADPSNLDAPSKCIYPQIFRSGILNLHIRAPLERFRRRRFVRVRVRRWKFNLYDIVRLVGGSVDKNHDTSRF